MTPEERAARLVRVNMSGRLALVMPGGSLVDPMIGEPLASEYLAHVIAVLRAAPDRDIADLKAAIQRNPEALAACLGTSEGPNRVGFGTVWFGAIVDVLRAHVRQGGNLLDALVHLLAQEHAAKARAMRAEREALLVNLCVRCRRPLPSQIIAEE